jgi:crossover junction endodeoxyribonuclease RuvC
MEGPAAPVVVLGIDPGTATTGYGVVRGYPEGEGRYEVLTYGVVETAADEPMPRRLLTLYRELRRLIGEYQPTAAAVEKLFFGRNTTTAISVGQARGVILLALAEAGLSVDEYTPAEIKQALSGSGRAHKMQMQRMTQAILDLPECPQPDDAADALAIVVCYLRLSRRRTLGLR